MNSFRRMAGRIVVALMIIQVAAPAFAADKGDSAAVESPGLGFGSGDSLFGNDSESMFDRPDSDARRTGNGAPGIKGGNRQPLMELFPTPDTSVYLMSDPRLDQYRLAAANLEPRPYPDSLPIWYPEEAPADTLDMATNDRIFLKGWLLITGVELIVLGIGTMLPKEWTGWSDTFIADGWNNFQRAYSGPPVWDGDHWLHNYVSHPYGGNVYYNTVRSQGAKKGQSFLFCTALSFQWEYLFEAVAERPSTQDLIVTPIFGSLLGEFVHRLTATLKKNGTNLGEKIIITILNPTSVFYNGYN